jgi:hypothetical protein
MVSWSAVSLFLCYINDQFIDAVYDQKASPRGHMGVLMNTSVTEGVFSDFAVYPAPEIKWPWQVSAPGNGSILI